MLRRDEGIEGIEARIRRSLAGRCNVAKGEAKPELKGMVERNSPYRVAINCRGESFPIFWLNNRILPVLDSAVYRVKLVAINWPNEETKRKWSFKIKICKP